MGVPDAPARALVIYGDGVVPGILPSHKHLHDFAASGCCGFLALRDLPSQLPGAERSVFEMRQLLDAHETYPMETLVEGCKGAEEGGIRTCSIPLISERFMGMKAAIVTTLKCVANLGKSLGFFVTMMDGIGNVAVGSNEETVLCKSFSELPTPSVTASQLLEMLGLISPCSNDMNTFELVLLHIEGGIGIQESIDWIDALVGEVKLLMQPGTKAADHLYLALTLGYGDAAFIENKSDTTALPSLEQLDTLRQDLTAFRPLQTYRMKDGILLDDIRDHHPLLVVHQMDGVTRRDEAKELSFEEFYKARMFNCLTGHTDFFPALIAYHGVRLNFVNFNKEW